MAVLDEKAQGVFVIAATPFKEDGALDLESTDRMIDFYLGAGATGLTILGMMGEAPKLTVDELRVFAERVIKKAGDAVPVVVGVSAPGFAQMQTLSSMVMDVGAAGVMVAPPASLATDQQIVDYYYQVADFIGDTPFVLQDFPLVTKVVVASSVITRIIKNIPTCVCLKHEDWPGLNKISMLRKAEQSEGLRRISVLCGNGGLFLTEEMARGADGAMTGFAYPEMMIDVVRHMQASQEERARDLFDAYLPLARYEQQPGLGLAIRKYILCKRGVISHANLRRPGPKLGAADIEEVELLIARQERRLAELG